MPITTATNPEVGRTVIQKIIAQEAKTHDNKFSKVIGKTITDQLNEYNYSQSTPLGLAPIVNQASGIPVDSTSVRNKKTMYAYKRGLGVDYSTEATETDQFGEYAKTGKKLARAFIQTKEIICADTFFNAAFTDTDIGVDSLPLYTSNGLSSGTGHLTDDPASRFNNRGVRSGTTYADVAFGYFGLELALQEFMSSVDARGLPMMVSGKKILVVPVALAGIANRVVNAMKLPQSGDNDPNYAGGMISAVVVSEYLTSTSAWFLLDVAELPFFMWQRRGYKVKMDENINNDVVQYRATEIYSFGSEKPQGCWGTTGA